MSKRIFVFVLCFSLLVMVTGCNYGKVAGPTTEPPRATVPLQTTERSRTTEPPQTTQPVKSTAPTESATPIVTDGQVAGAEDGRIFKWKIFMLMKLKRLLC